MRWFYDFVHRSNIGIAGLNPSIYAHFSVVFLICFVSEGPISFQEALLNALIHSYFQKLILNRKRSENRKR
jgi:ABC-type Co2+ transport system permease subunit